MRPDLLPAPRHWVLLPAAGVLLVYGAGIMLKASPELTVLDQGIVDTLRRHRTPMLDQGASLLNTLFGLPGGTIVLASICLAVLLLRRSLADAVMVGTVTVAGCVACWALKLAVGRQSPGHHGIPDPHTLAVSFPSGHTSCAVSLGIALVLLTWHTKWRPLALALAFVLGATVAASRVYLAAHYPTDTAASFLLSAAAAAFWAGTWNHLAARAGKPANVWAVEPAEGREYADAA